jgi:hypothetical protein
MQDEYEDDEISVVERIWINEQREIGVIQGMTTFPCIPVLHMSTPLSMAQWTWITSKFRPVNHVPLVREWEMWISFQEVWVLVSFLEQWHHTLEHFTIYYLRDFRICNNTHYTDVEYFEIYISRLCSFLDCFLSSSVTFPRLQTLRIVMNACNSNTHHSIASFPGYEEWEKKVHHKCPKLRHLELGWMK